MAIERGLESEQNVFRKQSTGSSFAVLASYRVTHMLAKERKPFSIRNLC